jgi:hypothetical protein
LFIEEVPLRAPKARGQSLVLIAVFIGVAVIAVLTFLGLSTLYAARSHARQSLQVATSAGSRRVDYGGLGGDDLVLDEAEAISTTRAVFESALSLQDFGLGASAHDIAQRARIEAHNDVPWTSPYSGLVHYVPTVAAVASIPVRIFFFSVEVPVAVETEVNAP